MRGRGRGRGLRPPLAARGRRGGAMAGGGARRGGGALAAAGLLALLLGGARGQQFDYDYGDYVGDDPGFSPAPLPPAVERAPRPAPPAGPRPPWRGRTPAGGAGPAAPAGPAGAPRPGLGAPEDPPASGLLANAVARMAAYFRERFGPPQGEPRPPGRVVSFLDRAASAAEQTRTGLESVLSGVSTVTGSLERARQEWDLLLRRRPAPPGRTPP